MEKIYQAKELASMPTLSQGHTDDLKDEYKHNGSQYRVWLSRMTVEDGMPYNNQITLEVLDTNGWTTVRKYQG